jgi:hypothetical protein
MKRGDVVELTGSYALAGGTAFGVLTMVVVGRDGVPLFADGDLLMWSVAHRPEVAVAFARGATATGTEVVPFALAALARIIVGRTVRRGPLVHRRRRRLAGRAPVRRGLVAARALDTTRRRDQTQCAGQGGDASNTRQDGPGMRTVGRTMRQTILVVEDYHGLRDVLMRGLRDEDFDTVPAPDSATALRLATPDI